MKKFYFGCLLTFLCANLTFAQQEKISFEVFFKLDKAVITEESQMKIDSTLQATQARRIHTRVSGHTCDLGTDNYNMGLSERRAQATFQYVLDAKEPEDKLELFFYGEKDSKYPNDREGRPLNRRVEITFTLEDDDRDTVVRDGCGEVFITKGSYQPEKNRTSSFAIKSITAATAFNNAGLLPEDKNGRKLYFSGVLQFEATSQAGKKMDLASGKNLKVRVPAAGEPKAGYTLYNGEDNGSGKIVWVNTGKPCEPKDCGYAFEMPMSGYCACAKPRKCEEDCNDDMFNEGQAPDLNATDIRYSGEGNLVQFPNNAYSKDLDQLDINVIDDKNLEEDLDVCDQFMYGVTTEEVFPAWNQIQSVQNLIVKAKDGSNDVASNGSATQTIYVPRALLAGASDPVIMPGIRASQGYVKWDKNMVTPTTCNGSVDCDYVVFEVPGTGNYKIGDRVQGTNPDKSEKYVLKTRVMKDNIVFVGNKSNDYVYKANKHKRKGKERDKEYGLRDFKNAGDMVVLVKNEKPNGKKFYQEATLSEMKFKEKKNMYIMRRRDFNKVDDFKDMELNKCN